MALASTSAEVKPAKINVVVHAVPEHAAVYVGDDRIGVSPGPIELEAAKNVTLTFKADGYKSADITVVPAENQPISITLVKVGGKKVGPHGAASHDANSLENPF